LAGSLLSKAVIALFALAAVGCNAHSPALPNMNLPVANEMPLTSTYSDVWTTFAYDYKRSGFNPNVTNLTKSNVSRLVVRWKKNIGGKIYASPVTYGGNLIVATEGSWGGHPDAIVYDLSTKDGHVLWQFTIAGRVKSTPAIDPDAGLVIVGDQTSQPYAFALRLLDGSLIWQTRVRGRITAAPVVAGGVVYVGRAGGDEPQCTQGGISAIDESTGQIAWNWNVDPNPKKGGSVWGAIAYDDGHLIFGTGNTCEEPITTANGAVSLNLDGSPAWSMVAVKDSHYDADTGGGVMVFKGRAHFINKNGRFYALDKNSGNIVWKADLNPTSHRPHWSAGFATPSTDGVTIVEGSGFYPDSGSGDGEFCPLDTEQPTEVQPGFHSELHAMSLSGAVIWTRTMQNRLVGYVALTGGMGFAGLNKDFVAIDLTNGKTLWKHPVPNYIAASMVVVPSGVYGADENGNVYAFTLPSS
jgi:outer membrane protein assembly factor BamB